MKNHGLFYLYKGFYALACSILYLMGEEISMIFREHIELVMQFCWTLCDTTNGRNARLLCPWGSPGKNTGVGCHFLLPGNFPTQRSNPGVLYCRQILYHLSYREDLVVGLGENNNEQKPQLNVVRKPERGALMSCNDKRTQKQ